MNNENRIIKIRALMNTNLEYTDPARSRFSQKFRDFLIDTDEKFRSLVIIPINDQVGLHNWAIDFVENPAEGFFVDIFCDNKGDFEKIYAVIIDRIPDTRFLFYNKGPVNSIAA